MAVSPESPRRGVVVLVGNPAPGSRTGAVARLVADGLASASGEPPEVVELADRAASVFSPGDLSTRSLREVVGRADLLVAATPVYKGGPTGLLKAFLDSFEPTALEGTVGVPVVGWAGSAHGAVAHLQLRLVLEAVGALVPVPSFVLEEHHLDDLPQYVDAWQQRFGPVVDAVVGALHPKGVAVR
jgi:FMN reductase